MKELISQLISLKNSPVNSLVDSRLKEFSAFKNHTEETWFSELSFCILAANSKQKTAEKIQESLGDEFLTIHQQDLANHIKENKHRFHNNKAKYIVEARQHHPIKEKLSGLSEEEARTFLVENVKGIGMKEASHFMRNTGSQDFAILDRHILNLLSENSIMSQPKSLSPKLYLETEKKFQEIAKKLGISPAKLDLLMWYLKTDEVAK